MYLVLGGLFPAFLVTAISSYHLWNTSGLSFLKYHSINISLSPWIVATVFTERFMIRPRLQVFHPEKMWDIETVSPSTRPKLQRSIRIKQIASVTYLFQCLATGFIFPLIGQICGYSIHSDIFYVVNYYSGTKLMKFLLCAILYLSHQIIAFYSISSYMIMKYTVQTVIIQLDILSDYLHQARRYKTKDYLSIRKHLKICAAHHIFILRLFKVLQELCYTTFVYLLITGQTVLLSCSIFLYYNRHPIYVLQIGSLLFLSYVLAMDCCQDGQSAEDAFRKFRLNLINFEWYNWDAVSKKMLLIMLTRTQKNETLNTLSLSINRGLMIMILKFAYQAMLIFLRFT